VLAVVALEEVLKEVLVLVLERVEVDVEVSGQMLSGHSCSSPGIPPRCLFCSVLSASSYRQLFSPTQRIAPGRPSSCIHVMFRPRRRLAAGGLSGLSSCLLLLSPQHCTSPSCARTHVWYPPTPTSITFFASRPNCPELFDPQHCTDASASKAQLCSHPMVAGMSCTPANARFSPS